MTEQVSTIVVMRGAAMIAGSKWNFLANNGNVQPINLEIMIVATRESDTTTARETSLYLSLIHISCIYCSFTSYPLASWKNYVEEYLAALFKEILSLIHIFRNVIMYEVRLQEIIWIFQRM